MLLFILMMCSATLVFGCDLDSAHVALWQVMKCDTVNKAAEALNITRDEIERLNPKLTPWFITPGEVLTVPYNPTVPLPATWFTMENYAPVLHLGYTECGQSTTYNPTLPTTNTNSQMTKWGTVSAQRTGHIPVSPSPTATRHSLTSSLPTKSPLCYHSGNHADEDAAVMEIVAAFACKAMMNENTTLVDYEDSISFLMPSQDGLNHYFAVRWTPMCKGPQSVAPSCSRIMYNNWKQCERTRSLFKNLMDYKLISY